MATGSHPREHSRQLLELRRAREKLTGSPNEVRSVPGVVVRQLFACLGLEIREHWKIERLPAPLRTTVNPWQTRDTVDFKLGVFLTPLAPTRQTESVLGDRQMGPAGLHRPGIPLVQRLLVHTSS